MTANAGQCPDNKKDFKVMLGSAKKLFAILFAVLFLPAAVSKTECGAAELNTGKSNDKATVVFKDGRLSVSVKNTDLAGLLREIGVKAGLEVIMGGMAEQKVTASFKELPLEEGLRKLLKNNNFFLCRPEGKKKPDAAEAGCDKGRLVIVKKAGEKTDKQAQSGGDPAAQQRNIQGGGDAASEIIAELLSDEPEVRSRGLARLNQGIESLGNLDPEILGALRLVMGEETRNSGLAGLREILNRSEGGRHVGPGN